MALPLQAVADAQSTEHRFPGIVGEMVERTNAVQLPPHHPLEHQAEAIGHVLTHSVIDPGEEPSVGHEVARAALTLHAGHMRVLGDLLDPTLSEEARLALIALDRPLYERIQTQQREGLEEAHLGTMAMIQELWAHRGIGSLGHIRNLREALVEARTDQYIQDHYVGRTDFMALDPEDQAIFSEMLGRDAPLFTTFNRVDLNTWVNDPAQAGLQTQLMNLCGENLFGPPPDHNIGSQDGMTLMAYLFNHPEAIALLTAEHATVLGGDVARIQTEVATLEGHFNLARRNREAREAALRAETEEVSNYETAFNLLNQILDTENQRLLAIRRLNTLNTQRTTLAATVNANSTSPALTSQLTRLDEAISTTEGSLYDAISKSGSARRSYARFGATLTTPPASPITIPPSPPHPVSEADLVLHIRDITGGPAIPATLGTLAVAAIPGTPGTPGTPAVAAIPGTPAIPASPGIPGGLVGAAIRAGYRLLGQPVPVATPAVAATLGTPAVAAIPGTPGTPGTPTIPAIPGTLAIPIAAGVYTQLETEFRRRKRELETNQRNWDASKDPAHPFDDLTDPPPGPLRAAACESFQTLQTQLTEANKRLNTAIQSRDNRQGKPELLFSPVELLRRLTVRALRRDQPLMTDDEVAPRALVETAAILHLSQKELDETATVRALTRTAIYDRIPGLSLWQRTRRAWNRRSDRHQHRSFDEFKAEVVGKDDRFKDLPLEKLTPDVEIDDIAEWIGEDKHSHLTPDQLWALKTLIEHAYKGQLKGEGIFEFDVDLRQLIQRLTHVYATTQMRHILNKQTEEISGGTRKTLDYPLALNEMLTAMRKEPEDIRHLGFFDRVSSKIQKFLEPFKIKHEKSPEDAASKEHLDRMESTLDRARR